MEESNKKNKIKHTLWMRIFWLSAGLVAAFCVLATTFTYFFVNAVIDNQFKKKKEYNVRLTEVIDQVEKHIDVDDLANCFKTGVASEKYVQLQQYLNVAVDELELTYLYVVVPDVENVVMVNVISATNAEERARGEEDMPIGERSDEYAIETLKEYDGYLKNRTEIFFFEEESGWGSMYTACKTLVTSDNEHIALLCADIPLSVVTGSIIKIMAYATLMVLLVFVGFNVFLLIFLRKHVTEPLGKLETATNEFAGSGLDKYGMLKLKYDAPKIESDDEVGSLARAIEKMAADLHKNVEENASTKRITKLSNTVLSLLDNMPAMTFYKDIETGKYLACNQAFAESAGKTSPREVIGLTDFDIYDEETAKHFVEYDRRAVDMDTPFVYYEEAKDIQGRPVKYRTTKLKFYDAEGKERLLGMCLDLSESEYYRQLSEESKVAYATAKKESVTYANIARSLSRDYAYIFYVNVETDDFIQYSSNVKGENLSLEQRGTDFFNESRKNALTILDKADREVFLAAFTKENILAKIDSAGSFTINYRMIEGPSLGYHNMKASYLQGDTKHVIFGVSNIDEQLKEQEAIKRIQDEKITYSRLTALTGDFLCIYTVDVETCNYYEYTVMPDYEKFGLAKKGEDFFAQARADGKKYVYSIDVDRFCNSVTKENVLAEINEHGMFELEYRMVLNDKPIYVTLKAALVKENDRPQLIFGIINIDSRIKREHTFMRDLSSAKKKADMDALTGVKNKHAYIDLETRLNRRIEDGDDLSFAVVICDINGLKAVNDEFGHVAGDEHIKKACSIICDVFAHSPVYRVGGDEFVAIVQGRDYDSIDKLVEMIGKINEKNYAEGKVSAACGMSRYQKGDRNVAVVFKRADAMMYYNKRKLKGEI